MTITDSLEAARKLTAGIFDVDGVPLASPHERAWREALAGWADPQLPARWRSLRFLIAWHGRRLRIGIDQAGLSIEATLESGDPMVLTIGGTAHHLSRAKPLRIGMAVPPARAA